MSFPGLGNAHSRKKSLMNAYDSGSSSGASEDDGIDPTVPDGTGEFRTWHRRKRRRTGQEARDDAALGVFGSDSEYEDSGPRGRRAGREGRLLRAHGLGFVKSSGGDVSMRGDDDDDQNEEENGESGPDEEEGQAKEDLGSFAGLRGWVGSGEDEEEENASRIGLGGAGRMGSMGRRGLGLGGAYPENEVDSYNAQEKEQPQLKLRRSFGDVGKKAGLFKGFTKAGLEAGAGSVGTSTGGGNTPHQIASGASTPGVDHRGLGSMEPPLPSFESPLGPGFVSSIAHQRLHEPVPFASPTVQEGPPLVVPKPSFTDFTQQSRGRGGKSKGGAQTPIPSVNPNSFAARMMAKMGYVPGQGLGTQGQGILAPIEVKLRPQGVGVGAIKEKTEQAKSEARRAAELRGEVLSDSESEKERKARKAKKKGAATGGAGADHVRKKKEKLKFKTAEEIEKSAVGLMVPSVLKSIVDMTGPEARVLDPTSGLFRKAVPEAKKLSPEEEERLKIARMARRDLESFAAEWQGLQDKKAYADQEEERLSKDVDEQTEQIQRLTALTELVGKMKNVSIDDDESMPVQTEEETFKVMVEQLETLQFQFKDELEIYKLSEIAVAAIVPVFKQCMATWTPISDPFYLTELLRRLRPLLKVKSREDIEARYNKRGYLDRPSKSATAYESLIYNLWLPKVRSAINNQWDVHDPSPVLTLLEAWATLLPPFIHANVLDQLVMPKLKAAITDWNPRLESSSNSSRKKRSAPIPPHIWIFPWLPHINAQTHLPSLLTDIKVKFTALLSSHPLTSGPIQGLPEWTELLGSTVIENLLIRHLLPRLALLLRTEFTVNPAEQDLSPLDALWRWQDGFRVSTLAQLLQAEMFPKWLNTLHMWLTSDGVVLGEVSAWYQFWQTVMPENIRASPLVRSEFDKGLDMINHAMDLGPGSTRAKMELPLPEAGPARPIKPAHEKGRKEKERELLEREREKEKARAAKANEQVSFRDAIEDWCAENNLLLIPLRKADEKTGQPLFRITASASGVGGLVVYLKNDVVWGQDKKSRDKFEPLGLGKVLERIGHM